MLFSFNGFSFLGSGDQAITVINIGKLNPLKCENIGLNLRNLRRTILPSLSHHDDCFISQLFNQIHRY